jgi:hypothetical protein
MLVLFEKFPKANKTVYTKKKKFKKKTNSFLINKGAKNIVMNFLRIEFEESF